MELNLPPPPKVRSRHGRVQNLKCLQEDVTILTDLEKTDECKLLVLDTDSADAEYHISSKKRLVSNEHCVIDT